MRAIAFAALFLIAGCGPEAGDVDAGIDAGVDGGLDGGPPDGGAICAPGCATGTTCCGTPEAPVCASLGSDIDHCGGCGIDCDADGRGDRCEMAHCACGDFELGCLGRFTSFCCVPAVGDPYCANLAQDRTDCGECGSECRTEEGSQCEGGRCVCGDDRDGCPGTPESTCCSDRFGSWSCADLRSDRNHCGACGNRCPTGERCVDMTCTP